MSELPSGLQAALNKRWYTIGTSNPKRERCTHRSRQVANSTDPGWSMSSLLFVASIPCRATSLLGLPTGP